MPVATMSHSFVHSQSCLLIFFMGMVCYCASPEIRPSRRSYFRGTTVAAQQVGLVHLVHGETLFWNLLWKNVYWLLCLPSLDPSPGYGATGTMPFKLKLPLSSPYLSYLISVVLNECFL